VALGGGVIGHAVAYRARLSPDAWVAVYWEWPVRAPAGVAYERVVLSMSGRSWSEPPSPAPLPGAGTDRRAAVVDALAGGPPPAATPAEATALDFLAGFGRQVVLSSAGAAR
jgi:hypothetical protein